MLVKVCAYLGALLLFFVAQARPSVWIPDPALRSAIEQTLGVWDVTDQDMQGLIILSAAEAGIEDLTGLEYAVELRGLYLSWNNICDITPLAGLKKLESLDLNNNCCSDISAIQGLNELVYLNIHMNQISDISPLSGLSRLQTLVARLNKIADISPIAGLQELVYLDLRNNLISDIRPLAGLKNLNTLIIGSNQINDIQPLSGLDRLQTLWLNDNQIGDITALSSLNQIQYLYLAGNRISDIAPLTNLTNLKVIDLQANPLDDQAYSTYLPIICQRNPTVRIYYDQKDRCVLELSSTAGGSIDLGTGRFEFPVGTSIYLEAIPKPGFVFCGWSGTCTSSAQRLFVCMDGDHQIRAHFRALSKVLYVDGNSPHDSAEDGSSCHPFDSIQEAVDVAADGASIIVLPGTYRQCIDITSTSITITSIDLQTGLTGPYPVLSCPGSRPVFRFVASEAVVKGFVITSCDNHGPIIESKDSRLTLANCVIVGNRSFQPASGIVQACGSDVQMISCTVADNHTSQDGACLVLSNSHLLVSHSIVLGNHPCQILPDSDSTIDISYSLIPGHTDLQAVDEIDALPDALFVQRGYWADPANPLLATDPADPRSVWIPGDYRLIDPDLDLGPYSGL